MSLLSQVHGLPSGSSDRRVVIISASPTNPSKTELLANMVHARLEGVICHSTHLRLRDLPPDSLIEMNLSDKKMAAAVAAVEQADGIILATPIYKASFSGLMKIFLDLLPQFGFARKVVFPLATGGTLAHVLALDYGLRPVLQSMGARWVVPSFFVTSEAFVSANEQPSLTPKFHEGLEQCISAFIEALCMGNDGKSAQPDEFSELVTSNPLHRPQAATLAR